MNYNYLWGRGEVPCLEEDPYNYNLSRNWDNTHLVNFNCAGYALETFTWYCPSRGDDDYQELGTLGCKEAMLEDFPDMRVVDGPFDLSIDSATENLIAFRLSSDGDLHYLKYNPEEKVWYHKMGSSTVLKTMTTKEVIETDWLGRYDKPILYFAKKRLIPV